MNIMRSWQQMQVSPLARQRAGAGTTSSHEVDVSMDDAATMDIIYLIAENIWLVIKDLRVTDIDLIVYISCMFK